MKNRPDPRPFVVYTMNGARRFYVESLTNTGAVKTTTHDSDRARHFGYYAAMACASRNGRAFLVAQLNR